MWMLKIEINFQDPLMRRIDGSHMIPPSAVIPDHIFQITSSSLQYSKPPIPDQIFQNQNNPNNCLCQVIHHRLPIKRPNRFTSWISNFQFQVTPLLGDGNDADIIFNVYSCQFHKFENIDKLYFVITDLIWRMYTNFSSQLNFQAKKIDVFSRAFFPFLFFVFNCWYWSYYLTRAQGKSQE